MPRKEFPFTMGADPEFNITMQGRRIKASDTLNAILGKDSEFSMERDRGMGYLYKDKGELGWDGNAPTGEIRPNPSKTADGLADNIGSIFEAFCKKNPLFDISTLSYFGSVGGHIHLSVPEPYQSEQKVRGIHKKLVSFYIPIMLSENKINIALRLKSNYGRMSENRIEWKNQEDQSRVLLYEFRTPSAEWMTTRKTAIATLAYVGTVYNEIINHPKKISKYADLFYKTEKQADALQQLALADYKTLTIAIHKRIRDAVRTFEFYKEYKEEIEYILNPKKVIADKIQANYNVPEGWGFKDNVKNPSKKDLVNKKKIKELAQDMNLDLVTSLVNITYNDDTNVAIYAKTLAERVAVFNWKLKNTYYLFGLRKGIQNYVAYDIKGSLYEGQEMIKTKSDLAAIYTLFNRMKDKFIRATNNNQEFNQNQIINGENGSTVIIGIPYDTRIEGDLKSFLNLIYDIEKQKESPVVMTEANFKNLEQDNGKTAKNKGEIYQILNRTSEQPDVVFDQSSASAQTQQNAIEILNESRQISQIEEAENLEDEEEDDQEEENQEGELVASETQTAF